MGTTRTLGAPPESSPQASPESPSPFSPDVGRESVRRLGRGMFRCGGPRSAARGTMLVHQPRGPAGERLDPHRLDSSAAVAHLAGLPPRASAPRRHRPPRRADIRGACRAGAAAPPPLPIDLPCLVELDPLVCAVYCSSISPPSHDEDLEGIETHLQSYNRNLFLSHTGG